jgi:hypothetical protein
MEGIGLAATVFDISGALYVRGSELDPKAVQKNDRRERRVSRTATLDGGIAVYDTGYAVADRSLVVRVKDANATVAAFLAYLVETYSEISITTSEAAFHGTPQQSYIEDDGTAVLEILITESA